MTEKNVSLDVEKKEIEPADEMERIRDRRIFVPRADIYEEEDKVVVIADLPGVDEKSLEILLEKNVLTIKGFVNDTAPEGYSLAYAEYGVGDYERKFMISNEIDQDGIEARVRDGVLQLNLPKAAEAQSRKIKVNVA
ncbi:MAG: Hsp20/alpha crystallin family protein [Anaerolineaceae bacterium]|nr:Hsp20/alpha crystallin family protein [Anaerolineaceae bacterium]